MAALPRARRHLDKCGAADVTLIITGGLRTESDFVKALALGADGVAITNAMRWTSPGTILRYGKKLRAKSSATARFLSSEPE